MQSVPNNFWEWIATLQSEERVGLIIAILIAAAFIIVVMAVTIYSMHKNRLDDSLKRELLDRGMSAAEIAAIMVTSPRTRRVEHVATTTQQGRNRT